MMRKFIFIKMIFKIYDMIRIVIIITTGFFILAP